jgi:Rrf2 family protein
MHPLSQPSEYALRALTHLALLETSERRLVREIADEIEAPAPFLSKVLARLAAAGLLESQRGRGGGYRLTRGAHARTLREVVETQEALEPTRCLLGQPRCGDEEACPLHEYWRDANAAFLERLEATTLGELASSAASIPCAYPSPGPTP